MGELCICAKWCVCGGGIGGTGCVCGGSGLSDDPGLKDLIKMLSGVQFVMDP